MVPEYEVILAKFKSRSRLGPKIKGVFCPCGREAELFVLERYPMFRVADVCRIPQKIDMKRGSHEILRRPPARQSGARTRPDER